MLEVDKEAFEKWIYDKEFPDGNPDNCEFTPHYYIKQTWQAACDYKQKEIDELNSHIKFQAEVMCDMGEIVMENKKLQAENAKLRECVDWYADLDNHKMIYDSGDGFVNTTEIDKDCGKRARQALKELEEK